MSLGVWPEAMWGECSQTQLTKLCTLHQLWVDQEKGLGLGLGLGLSFSFFFFFFFLGLHLWQMEVPRLGVESDPGYATAIATPDLSHVCDLCNLH